MEPNSTNAPKPPVSNPAPQGEKKHEDGDNSSYKLFAVLGYIIPILFFVPLLSDAKHNAFAKFHANQQLNLLILWAASQIIVIIPILGWIIAPLLVIFGLVCMIIGIINAANDRMKELPVIGKWQLIN